MARGVRVRLVWGLLFAALVPASPAAAQTLSLSASRSETGWIRLTATAPDATNVTLTEEVGDVPQPLADVKPSSGKAELRHAEIWRCDRRQRRFVATASYPDGTTATSAASITTPACTKRLTLAATARRGRVAIRVTDRWGVGDVPARACVAAAGRKLACHSVRIPGGRKWATLSYRARTSGLWSAVLQTAWGQRATERVYVRPKGRLRLLATGDSMIQYVDLSLNDRLGRRGFKVKSDARISTGLSKPFLLNWPKLAKKQAARFRPDVSVVFIGANDGFPFGKVDCCGDAWVDAYAARARSMMSAYSRQGRGLVYWLTLPAPRPAEWRPIYPAVNRALKRAAAGFAGRVRIVDIAKVFTPGFRFRSTMVWHGRRLTVRQADGVHLSQAGASIAETLIQRALKADGVIG
jgi:lysophospholipase L1-like esterase